MGEERPLPQPVNSDDHEKTQSELIAVVGNKETRKIRARRRREDIVWFGLGTFGVVGWSVAIPTVLFVALGLWIDRRWPSPYSWTLMLLLAGVLLGCLNAWYWLVRERGKIEQSRGDNHHDSA